MDTVLSQASVGALLLEGIKYIWRKFIIKNLDYEFPQGFYLISIPILQAVAVLILALLGVTGYAFPTDWVEFTRQLVLLLVSSLVSTFVYTNGIKPMRDYKATIMTKKSKAVKVAKAKEDQTLSPN